MRCFSAVRSTLHAKFALGAGLTEVQAFAYRAPRFSLELPVAFLVEGAWIQGHTRDLSDQGLLVRFVEPVLSGTSGRVRLFVDRCCIEIEARVTYAELYEAGMTFHFASRAEEEFVRTLVKLVSKAITRGTAVPPRVTQIR